jgi:hypothetical protein
VVPTQTLYLLNSPFVKEEARLLASSVLADTRPDAAGRVSRIMLRALNRQATERDVQQASEFIAKAGGEANEAWTRYCHAILVSSEFLYRR